MFTLSRFLPASAIVAALAASSVGVLAQDQPAPAQQPPGAGDTSDQRHGAEHHWPKPSQFIEARIAYLKTALQITPAQTAQFNAVAEIMRKDAKERDAKMAAFQSQPRDEHKRPDPIEMMEHRQKAMTEGAAKLGETVAAWKPLYASLSDSQKQLLPELIGHHGHHRWGHGGGW